MEEHKTCQERVKEQCRGRIEDLEKLWKAYQEGEEDRHSEELGCFCEYGLSFDYVAPDTFHDQDTGYFRYQLSWGGPSEEFRFYGAGYSPPNIIEFWLLDWNDGACEVLTGDDRRLLLEIFEFFDEAGSVQTEYDKAVEC